MNNRTELVFLLDRSGSMSGLESDTIGGFNGLLEKQKKLAGECRVTTVLFDDRYELLHDRIDLAGVCPITESEYFVRGSTALLDALGRTIAKIKKVQQGTAAGLRAEKILFVIITDGLENASREYSTGRIREMVSEAQEKHGWEFLFLGANLDATTAAGDIGIVPERAVRYHADKKGTAVCYDAVSAAAEKLRCNAPIDAGWKERVEHDFIVRNGER